MENFIETIGNRYNAVIGVATAIMSMVFGRHWILFVSFLVLNIIDYVTGVMKARIGGKDNSAKGLQGIIKKLGYWLMIMVGFMSAAVFIEIGKTIGVNLEVTAMIGYFVLCTLIINELRSIVENFVEAGYNVPAALKNGLQITEQMMKSKEKPNEDTDQE